MSVLLRESVAVAPVKSGNRWKVIVAKPGQGSSGFYSEELFKRDAAKIIAPGGKAYIGHDDKRDVREMIGVYPDGAKWSEEDQAVVAELAVFSHWSSFVDEVGPHCGMSLYANGTLDEAGNVTSFIEDVINGADLVSNPGLVGSGLAEKLYEEALAASDKTTPGQSGGEGKDRKIMDEKAIEAINALTTQVTALVSAQTAKTTEDAQVEANSKAVEEKVASITANLDAVEAAREDLLPTQVEALRSKAKAGVDVTPLIEEYKTMVAEVKTLVEAAGGTVGIVKGAETATTFGAYK